MKTTNKQKELRGTNQPCRMTPQSGNRNERSDENKIDANRLSAIPKVKLKGTAKRIFEYTATELLHKNMLDIVGVDLLMAYCREMALYHDTMRLLEKEGHTIEVSTKFGTVTQVNPKRKVAESALAAAKSLAVEFGFTPASRSRVAAMLDPAKPKDDFIEFEEI